MSFEPKVLNEIRFWVERQGWRSKELCYDENFQVKVWRRQGENVQMTWRKKKFSVIFERTNAPDSWFMQPEVTTTREEMRLLPDAAAGVNVLRTFVPVYDFAQMSDKEVLHYLSGKEITWRSAETDVISKHVIPKAPSTSMSRSRMGRRAISFAPSYFVSAALDAITEIR